MKRITLLISLLVLCTPASSKQVSIRCETVEKWGNIPNQSKEYEIIIDELNRRVFIDGPSLFGEWFPAVITHNLVKWTFNIDGSPPRFPDKKIVITINRITGKYTGTIQHLPDGEARIIQEGECKLVQRRF